MLLNSRSQAHLFLTLASNSNRTDGPLSCANATGTPTGVWLCYETLVTPFRHGKRHGTSQPLGDLGVGDDPDLMTLTWQEAFLPSAKPLGVVI